MSHFRKYGNVIFLKRRCLISMGGLSSLHSKISKPSAVFMIVLLCLLNKRPWCLCNPDPI